MDESEVGRCTKKCSICRESRYTIKYCHARNEQHERKVGGPTTLRGPHPTAPLEAGTVEGDMANVEVAATGMVYLIEICCDECFGYCHYDLSNNYVMMYVLFSCVVRCTGVVSCVE